MTNRKHIDHELKMDRDVFQAAWDGIRPFEVRFNDRDFKVGDMLTCRETVNTGEQMKNGAPLEYTGREINRKVTYIENGPKFGLGEGWVIMSVENVQAYTAVA